MKKFIKLTSLCFSIFSFSLSYADTCPLPDQFSPTLAPGGWTILMPAIFPGDHYYFANVTHSFNPNYYNLQVICRYECLPNEKACSPFTLISNATYTQPTKNQSPWNVPPILEYTLVCSTPDHNPLNCVFSNIPNNDSIALNDFKREWRTLPENLIFVC